MLATLIKLKFGHAIYPAAEENIAKDKWSSLISLCCVRAGTSLKSNYVGIIVVPGGVERILAAQGCLTIEESSSAKANSFIVLIPIVPGKAKYFCN